MFYKIPQGTPLFDRLMELKAEMYAANKAAYDHAKAIGGTGTVVLDRWQLAGGLEAVEFDKQPARWKCVRDRLYVPFANNREALDKIRALPTVSKDRMADLVNFKEYRRPNPKGDGSYLKAFLPGYCFRHDGVLLRMPEGYVYTPPPGVVEILASEFNRPDAD